MTSRAVLRISSEGNCALGLPPLTGKRSIFSMVELLTWFQHIEILSGQRRFALAVLNSPGHVVLRNAAGGLPFGYE